MRSYKCPKCHLSSLANGYQVPQYVREEYATFQAAIDDLVLEEKEGEDFKEMLAVKRVAYTLNNVVYIIISMIKELGVNLLVFTLLEGIQGILSKLNALQESIKAMPTLVPKLVRGQGGGRHRGSHVGRGQGGSRAGSNKESSSPLADLDA